MKKVLVTGAAGSIGIQVIKYLLAEGSFEVTALDLKNKTVIHTMRKYKKRVNVLYGDINDRVLVEALVKDHDYIIHLASATPPLADMKKGLSDAIDYNGTENLVRAINYYNPKCHLFLASTTSMYLDKENCSVKSHINEDEIGYFAKSKLAAERLIKEKISNWTIYRIPLLLTDPLVDPFMYHGIKDELVDVITKEDAAYAFVLGIKNSKTLNKKIYNLADEEPIKYGELIEHMTNIVGFNIKCTASRLFLEKDFHSPITKDRDELVKIIPYRNDTLPEYFNRLRARARKRDISRLLVQKEKKVTERNIAVCILLSIITFDIYGIYWVWSLNNEVNTACNKRDRMGVSVVILTILTLGIYGWYWNYSVGKRLNIANKKYKLDIKDNSILYMILAIIFLPIISYALIQNNLNRIYNEGDK